LCKDGQNKLRLINNLNIQQLQNFITLFNQNAKQADYILLNVPDYFNITITNKIYKLIKLGFDLKFVNKVEYNLITKYNIKDIVRYLNDDVKFKNRTINVKWGPGNNKDIETNIVKHYEKHVLDIDEKAFWNQTLSEQTLLQYEQYAIDNFYKMTNVMVHTNGKNVHLSGFYGNVFIVGRYDKNTECGSFDSSAETDKSISLFGISSCYYVNSNKTGRENTCCFTMSFN